MRNRGRDLKVLDELEEALKIFKEKKWTQWERVDDTVQAHNRLASPSEDWINPPDEQKTLHLLEQDKEYVTLRHQILHLRPKALEIARFLRYDEAVHVLTWLSFASPLIGNSILEQAISTVFQVKMKCSRAFYFWYTLLDWIGSQK